MSTLPPYRRQQTICIHCGYFENFFVGECPACKLGYYDEPTDFSEQVRTEREEEHRRWQRGFALDPVASRALRLRQGAILDQLKTELEPHGLGVTIEYQESTKDFRYKVVPIFKKPSRWRAFIELIRYMYADTKHPTCQEREEIKQSSGWPC